MLRNHAGPTQMGQPLDTFATARHHFLTVPPGADTQTSRPALVIPYRKGAKPHRTDRPLSTIATREAHGLLRAEVAVQDCYFRMLKPREAANAQRFRPDYTIHGNNGEQQMQAGNAVPVNVARWIGEQIKQVL
jgi:DNA (cytosine-5)-methyltransferase 1